ncbi:sporulation transcription factor Spo0A [Pelotomaculum isophthalicicum JI]|uniref:Stage 0 sporulation protein A homolog n=1 Tax=Pelotomaculum isophthalicicum JI TaxID=947010 RepID=A0A9X4JWU1_9FIRM|nr:sporulation transcription factor Spo0A [Pelotomaculum isophthalicicum]MDF9410062.1 sporulation transcription factor Spo0A [Pelotomaculum isophthalicicum JI]
MKSGIKVLIADDNREFCELLSSFIEQQNGLEIVGVAHNGLQAIEFIREYSPDVVVLDIIMPQLDGIGVLENLAGIGKRPKVIMLTAFGQESITRRSVDLGADYFILKPFDFNLLVNHIRQLANEFSMHQYVQQTKKRDLDTDVTNVMHEMGIPAHVKGYHYLREAVIMAYNNTSLVGALTKELYPMVAKRFNTTPSKVERAIRHAIQLACDRGNVKMIHNVFGYTMNIERGKPTNGQFISVIADKLIMEEKASGADIYNENLSSRLSVGPILQAGLHP